ncbi:hypothetical protein D5085_00060 [Ectothiorhodospiraceae bacterium BW-2]|nr:hypothetical protein D5085_00060 [Ectothiorhodospiraceae bacterium BW-2]
MALKQHSFSSEEIECYLAGDLVGCFGEAFYLSQTHTRTPRSAAGSMNFIGDISAITTDGGPAGRGYLRSVSNLTGEEWFFNGHFHHDPCMPGTLMAEGCLQMMSFYLVALGYTLQRDSWRFQPAVGNRYRFHCRGQVTPASKQLVYELFVDEIVLEPTLTLYAHLLCTVDGRKAFLCERLGVELVPDWPLLEHPIADPNPNAPFCYDEQGFAFNFKSVISCAWGKPTDAFGARFAHFNRGVRSSRLPGPPYHFMSRIVALEAEFGQPNHRPSVVVEYDVAADSWFFRQNGTATMPYCVLMEIALQPCGWIAFFCRDSALANEELLFRNLDGLEAVQHFELKQGRYTLRTEVILTSHSRTGRLVINQFEVKTYANGELVYSYQTTFGFFPPEAMLAQKGLIISANDRHLMALEPNLDIDLTTHPADYFNSIGPSLPASRLLMLDRLVHYSAAAGEQGRGYLRGEKRVNSDDWFFKAHFFQDPVQPGSLGVEAILQLMQLYILLSHPEWVASGGRFEPVIIAEAVEWHYRGQITPHHRKIVVDMEQLEAQESALTYQLWAKAKVWIDGLKIYEMPRVGMRLNKVPPPTYHYYYPWRVDAESSPWVWDHCPTYTLPTLPFTWLIELAATATGIDLGQTGLHSEQILLNAWLALTPPARTRRAKPPRQIEGEVKVSVNDRGTDRVEFELFRFDEAQAHPLLEPPLTLAASGDIGRLTQPPKWPTIAALQHGLETELPYERGELFHGPALQLLTRYCLGSNGATATITAQSRGVAHGRTGFALLDGAIQSVPHYNIQHWCGAIAADLIAYPYQMRHLTLLALPQSGELTVESRFVGQLGERLLEIDIWLRQQQQIVGYFRLVEVLVSKGITQQMSGEERYRFIKQQQPLPPHKVIELSAEQQYYRLPMATVEQSSWLPGTLESIYRLKAGLTVAQKTAHILFKEYVAAERQCHPAEVEIESSLIENGRYLEQQFALSLVEHRGEYRLYPLTPLRRYPFDLPTLLRQRGVAQTLLSDLLLVLSDRFIAQVKLADFNELSELGPVIYLANHQVAVESILFVVVSYALFGYPIATLSKAENRDHWLGKLSQWAKTLYGESHPLDILYFQRDNPAELPVLIDQCLSSMTQRQQSLFIHVGGTREQYEGEGIAQMSSFILDRAVKFNRSIVPICFTQGLPLVDQGHKFELPHHLRGQNYNLGRVIRPAQLQSLNSAERVALLQQQIEALAEPKQDKADDSQLRAKIAQLQENHGLSPFTALGVALLQQSERQLCRDTQQLLDALSERGSVELF